MTTLWLDGFDHYLVNQQASLTNGNYDVLIGSSLVVTSNPRTGTQGIRCGNSGDNLALGKTTGNKNKLWAGVGIRPNYTTVDYECCIALSQNNAGVNPFVPGTNASKGSGLKAVTRLGGAVSLIAISAGGADTVLATTAAGLIPALAYSYLEIRGDVAAGTASVWLNGNVNLLNVSGISGIGTNFDRAFIGCNAFGGNDQARWDDFYIDDANQLGAQRCYTLFPDSDVAPQNWTYSSGAAGFSLINQAQYNVANFIQGVNVGDKATFGMQNLPVSNGIINGVRLSEVLFNASAGSSLERQRAFIGAGTFEGTDHSPSTSATYFNDTFSTPGATVANINAMNMQVEKTA